jgi:hypothetical protein
MISVPDLIKKTAYFVYVTEKSKSLLFSVIYELFTNVLDTHKRKT